MSSQNSCDSLDDMDDNLGFTSFFNNLQNTKRSVDVIFIIETPEGEVEISAHQLVLSMRSTYFADMFYDDRKEKENKIIRLERVNPKAFEDMIRYCYDSKPTLDTLEEISAMHGVASQFKVINLMNLCRKRLGNIHIEPKNVLSVLEVSEYIGEKEVSNVCAKFIEKNTKEVIESYEMNKVTPAMVRVIVCLPELSLHTEYELIKWIFEWAKVKCKEEESAHKSIREYLEELLYYMNFLALTSEEFAILCNEYPDFFSSDEIASFFLNIASFGSGKLPEWFNKDWKFHECIGKRIDNEIEVLRKCIPDILVVVKELEETIEYITMSENYIEEFEDSLKFSKVTQAVLVHNLRNKFRENPIFSKRDKGEILIELSSKKTFSSWKYFSQMTVPLTEALKMEVRTINKIAKDVFEETERVLNELNCHKFGFTKFLIVLIVLNDTTISLFDEIAKNKFYKELQIRKHQLSDARCHFTEAIKNLNESHDEFANRLRQLTEKKFEKVKN